MAPATWGALFLPKTYLCFFRPDDRRLQPHRPPRGSLPSLHRFCAWSGGQCFAVAPGRYNRKHRITWPVVLLHIQRPLNNGCWDANGLHSQKSMYDFWLLQDLTTNSLLLMRSLTDSIKTRLTHTLFMYCILYSYSKVERTKWKIIWKRKYIYGSAVCL